MISYLGLSHLSLCYAASALKNGYKVNIYDFEKTINFFKKNKIVYEKNLDSILNKYKSNLTITSNFKKIKNSKLIFLAKDLNTDKLNKPKINEINKLINKIKMYKKNKILIILTQVPVSFCRQLDWNKNNLYHYVETLIFGHGISRALKPERIILGKKHFNKKVHPFLRKFLKKYKCPLIEMSYEESEMTKAFINIYLASQVTTTNYLNELANKFNADWSKIKSALILDKRISKNSYLNPGLGISGGNIERDLVSISSLKRKNKLVFDLTQHFISASHRSKNWPYIKIKKFLKKNSKVGILGFTYKENTISFKNAPSINLISKIGKNRCIVHDKKNKLIQTGNKIKFLELSKILSNSNYIIILHNILEYKKINFKKYKNIKIVVDPFKIIDKKNLDTKQRYFCL